MIHCADQDSVRLLAVEACGPLARLLNKGESVQHVLPIVKKFSQACSPSKQSCIASIFHSLRSYATSVVEKLLIAKSCSASVLPHLYSLSTSIRAAFGISQCGHPLT